MSLFSKVNTNTTAPAETDSLGGRVFDSGVVDFIIEMAYISTAGSGAMGLNVHLKEVGGNRVFKAQEWIYSGNEKGNKNTYTKDGKEFYLPGWLTGNAITQLAADRKLDSLNDDDIVKKTIKLWRDGSEQNTEVDAIDFLIGKPVTVGVLKEIVDKTVKNDQGKYVPTGQTREQNTIGKVFHTETGFTVKELTDGATLDDEPKFRNDWAAKNTGEVKDKSTKTDINNGSAAKVPPPMPSAGSATPAAGSLFPNRG